MDKQLYSTLRELAWHILIQGNISKLPVAITPIAKAYQLEELMDYSGSRYSNAIIISEHILKHYGIDTSRENIKFLATHLLTPLCILKECHILTPDKISKYCDVPYELANERSKRLSTAIKYDKFYLSSFEEKVSNNFTDYINNFNDKDI